jgi:hypothetical protein
LIGYVFHSSFTQKGLSGSRRHETLEQLGVEIFKLLGKRLRPTAPGAIFFQNARHKPGRFLCSFEL